MSEREERRVARMLIRACSASWGLKGEKWAYTIDEPGEPAFVSDYRYRSEANALKAGEKDARALEAARARGEA